MKIQPFDVDVQVTAPAVAEVARVEPAKTLLKSRLKRLFDRQFSTVLRITSVDKHPYSEQQLQPAAKEITGGEVEPSSLCLANMVQSYLEDANENKPYRGRHRCNCFNPNGNDSSDDDFDTASSDHSGDAVDLLKNLIPCPTLSERELMADTTKIVEKHKNQNQSKSEFRKAVAIALSSLGYNSAIAKSKWEKSSSTPAGEYEYIDVIVDGGDRLIVDIEFRSEFEIARSTGSYKSVLQSLPIIFVGESDRLDQIVGIVSEAAKISLKKKGMYCPPWRKVEYMQAKWLAPYSRQIVHDSTRSNVKDDNHDDDREPEVRPATANKLDKSIIWQAPAIKRREIVGVQRSTKIVTGLASLLKEKT